ncbi:hypothetical protein [Actinoplanes cyaneus]|nr:hypothetical protein [Actinoplanes cyaneus]
MRAEQHRPTVSGKRVPTVAAGQSADGRTGPVAEVRHLQRVAGNRAVETVLQRMAKKKEKGKGRAPVVEPEPEPVNVVDAALGAIAGRLPGFGELPRNVRIDYATNAGILQPAGDGEALETVLTPDMGDDYEDAITEVQGELGRRGFVSGYDEAGAGASDWASSRISGAAGSLRESAEVKELWGGRTTLHHKISRSRLDLLLKWMKGNPRAKPMERFIERMKEVTGATSDTKVLWNMPANLELGAASDTRLSDPGSGFDGNVDQSGRNTPRTSALSEADRLITQLSEASTEEDFQEIADLLEEANVRHLNAYRGAVLSDPQVGQWEQKGSKWKRNNGT